MVAQAGDNMAVLFKLFNFKTSVADGSLEQGFSIKHFTQASRVGTDLIPRDGFELPALYQHKDLENIEFVRQHLSVDGIACERLFCIDTIKLQLNFSQSTE